MHARRRDRRLIRSHLSGGLFVLLIMRGRDRPHWLRHRSTSAAKWGAVTLRRRCAHLRLIPLFPRHLLRALRRVGALRPGPGVLAPAHRSLGGARRADCVHGKGETRAWACHCPICQSADVATASHIRQRSAASRGLHGIAFSCRPRAAAPARRSLRHRARIQCDALRCPARFPLSRREEARVDDERAQRHPGAQEQGRVHPERARRLPARAPGAGGRGRRGRASLQRRQL